MVLYLPSIKGESSEATVSLSCRDNLVTVIDVQCKSSLTRSARIVTGGMSRAFGHSSDPLIVIFEIFRNIMKDGTGLTMMALAVSAFNNGELKRVDIYMPLPIKIFGATTQKTHACRVKEKLAEGRDNLLAP